jgi:Sec-independent protein secretion pathway component TatC
MKNGCVHALTWTLISAYWQWRMAAPKLYKKEERLTLREHSSSRRSLLGSLLLIFLVVFVVSCYMSLRSEFRVVMSITISA